MTPILLLSLPADADKVRNIAGALSESDLDIFWDRAEAGGAGWEQALERSAQARCVLFFWSDAAARDGASPYAAHAREALAAGKAICVRLDDAPLPEGLSGCTLYDLRGWRSRASSLFMLDLVAGAKAKAAGLDPPLPRAPRQLLVRRLAIAVPSAVAAVALAVGLYRDIGLDRVAGSAEKAAWATLRPGSCADLRSFLARHSDGVHAAEAQARLGSRTVSTRADWRAAERPLPLYVAAADATAARDEAAARRDALARAEEAAGRACGGLARAGSGRVQEASPQGLTYQCEQIGGSTICAAEGEALCRILEPVAIEEERCG